MNEMKVLEVVNETKILGKVVKLYNSVQEPWFEANEVAGWLNIQNVSQMLKQAGIPDSKKAIFLKYTLGGNQKSLFITEDAMYDVLMFSRKKEAKPMRNKIKYYLKSIRLTGAAIPKGNEEQMVEYYFSSFSDDIKLMMVKELQAKVNELQQFYDDILNTEGLYHMNMVAKELNIGRNTMLSYLRGKDILFYQDGANVPFQRFMNQGLFAIKETPCHDGIYRPVTYATKKGLEYIRKLLHKDGYYKTIHI